MSYLGNRIKKTKGNKMAQVTFTGIVDRIFFDGKGLSVIESRTNKGTTFTEAYTCWFQVAPAVKEGDTLTISGLLGKKIDTYTDKEGNEKQKFVLVVNNAQAKLSDTVNDLPF
jgi:hypothetical protein